MRTRRELERYPLAPGQKVKLPPPPPMTETGAYLGSLAAELELSAEEKKSVRRVFFNSEEPLHITAVAARAGINFLSPHKQSAVSRFIGEYLVNAKEVERVEAANRYRQNVFQGYALTLKGRELQEKGLA